MRRFSIAFGLILLLPGCDSTLPSARLQREVQLPKPVDTSIVPAPERLTRRDRGERYRLSPRTLIPLAFHHQPDIKSSYERFKSEEARYDFFIVSRDSLTPRLRTANRIEEFRADETVTRRRDHSVEVAVEKEFFDTTQMDVSAGLRGDEVDRESGFHPFVSAGVRYPLWVSRQRLERTSEEIFRRNEMNDAQLDYIQEVRSRLRSGLFQFHDVADQQRRLDFAISRRQDLEALHARLEAFDGRDLSADLRRIEAEISSVAAQIQEQSGRLAIDIERLKAAIGLPFHAQIELIDEIFNPFEGMDHEELLRMSIEADPEIATLQNEQRNAEVQFELARRGRWDINLLLDAESDLEGSKTREGVSRWALSVGLDISAVDPRVTESLMRQAQGRIDRFKQAIIARENDIFTDTFEPIIRIETLSASRDELIQSLPQFEEDYQLGIQAYLASGLSIDDLLKRRERIFDHQAEISRLMFLVGANVAELLEATGMFFEMLDGVAEE